MKDFKQTYIKIFKSNLAVIALVLVLTIPAIVDTLKPGYFPMHDNLQVMRQSVMQKCFQDFQIPCRWSLDMGYGYGYPIFNYYPPFPYYLGEGFKLIGFSYVKTIKALFILSILLSGVGMYLLAAEFWGRVGGVISAVFYIYAPYHAVDVYVRGAMNEAWGITWFPFILFYIFLLIKTKEKKYIILTAISSAFLMLSHNLMLMIFVPVAITWAIFWFIIYFKKETIRNLIFAALWALGLSSFFTIPVLFEQNYVHINTLTEGYFNYLAHFVTLKQLFLSSLWGYGPSIFGPNDDLSFSIGILHWIFSLLSIVVAVLIFKKSKKMSLLLILMFLISLGEVFMTHQRSSFIWNLLPPLQFLQFPWRFLSTVTLTTSFLAGSIFIIIQNLKVKYLSVIVGSILVIGCIFLYQNDFHWKVHWYWMNDKVQFSGDVWLQAVKGGIYDYLPISVPIAPGGPPNGNAEIVSGQAVISTAFKNSVKQVYMVNANKPSIFQLNTYYFPGWTYFLDGAKVSADIKSDHDLGRPRFLIRQGTHKLEAVLFDTLDRRLANIFSLISWMILIMSLFFYFRRQTASAILAKFKINKLKFLINFK